LKTGAFNVGDGSSNRRLQRTCLSRKQKLHTLPVTANRGVGTASLSQRISDVENLLVIQRL
jgi:hypothetical protein